MNKKTLGIIGLGRFGKLAAAKLKRRFRIAAYDTADKRKAARKLGIAMASLSVAASSDIVVLCVPISKLRNSIIRIKPYVKKGSIVMDVCSVKEYPARIMKKLLPKQVDIIATHPLFGPDSFMDAENRKIVVCPVRIKPRRLSSVRRWMKKFGLKVIITNPSNHDRKIANALSLVHSIGRALSKAGIRSQEIDTLGYRRLVMISDHVTNDTMQLFNDMNAYNRFSGPVIRKFIRTMQKVSKSW
ncbi:prephenate dehydrogenase/arogenate dehydrogenase family protein [Candidatus Woesearchaeota archaeon]|nr:prephenate dehydrogenase/arogenate dehydrogenase family protein [Candidatus Woesearchaeota archaeon]